ncbi:MAG: APC family permease [Chitinophagaceae bacterium]
MRELFRKKDWHQTLRDAQAHPEHASMRKVLGVRDLTFFGIAAIIGAGIFSSIGKACFDGGPAVVLLYVFTAVACGFAALCYAEFASTIPVSGSAYTYAYLTFGELFAWIIGWDLLMEYAIGNIAVAISWSDYFTHILHQMQIPFPEWLSMDWSSAKRGAEEYATLIGQGTLLNDIAPAVQAQYMAWTQAPQIGAFKLIADVPAFAIVVLITAVVYVGINESRRMSNAMVMIKLAIIFGVIVAGGYYVKPENWSPFAPEGMSGVLKGVSAVFFAYIGFDAISTTAEECKNPQRDLPRAMLYALVICTVLYVLLALVLTGMVPYTELNVGDPLSMIFEARGIHWIAGIVAGSAVIATAGVLLVFQMGQPRIWMSMSRDGLLPPIFSRLHPKFKTPSFSTVLTGLIVGIPALFLNLDVVISLTSIGTLFAFVLVCAGVLVMQQQPNKPASAFQVPYINGKLIVPGIALVAFVSCIAFIPNYFNAELPWPMMLFWLVLILVAFLSWKKSYSLIPVLGLLACFYLMAQESHSNWMRFLVWLVVGLLVYFLYSRNNSRLAPKNRN